MEKPAPSTGEIRRMLQDLLEGLRAMPVVKWLAEGQESPAEVGEIVGLMLEVDVALMSEVDTFIGSAGQGGGARGGTGHGGAAGTPATGSDADADLELLDLPPDEEAAEAAEAAELS